LRQLVVATGADTVICDGELSPAQLNALEKVVKVKVIDRTALILDIFAQHATSREGKAQVELAQMQYMLPRLRGWGESMSRQAGGRAGGSGGGVGTRGPGETKIETDRRRIRERMSRLRREIKDMKKVRDTQRSRRKESDVPSIAIVGYTNAGKSSLLNALTGAGVLVENALFATLEPTTRRGEFDDGRPFVVTDTVGFVRHLPTQLVEAFRSTLEEVLDADLLVHVVDGADANPMAQIEAVRQVIAGTMKPLSGPIRSAMGESELELQPGIPLEELKQRVPNLTGMPKREFEHFIRQYETLGLPPDRVKYPVQVWRIGTDFTFIALTGETVVDYSLKFKAAYGWNNTWVCGYNNDLTSYIPSLRVLKEGGYEGLTGMFEYGHRAPYTEAVEERITTKVSELVDRVK
jgi:GTP-binding protein HflX